MIGQPDDLPVREHLFYGILDGQTGLFIDDVKDFSERLIDRFRFRPAAQGRGDRIQKRHLAGSIGDNDGVPDAFERHAPIFFSLA